MVGTYRFIGVFLVCALLTNTTLARIIYSNSPGGNWTSTSSWIGGIVPVSGDTVVIQSGHTISVTTNEYNNSTYLFLIVVGTLDLTNNGKLSFNATSKVIIETGGRILGNGNSDQISIGTGGPEYSGSQGTITGPSYVSNGHSPSSGEGTGGCGCYTPGSIPLPIELIWFKGSFSDPQVTLEWATASEKNFDKFMIEKSINGIAFDSIGYVHGAGFDTKEKQYYSFIDTSPFSPRTYYRLKNVDLDRSFEYSKIIKVDGETDQRILVFPNPVVNQSLTVKINFEPMQFDKIQIVSSVGNVLIDYPASSLESTINFDGKLNSGVYILRYIGAHEERMFRFVIVD